MAYTQYNHDFFSTSNMIDNIIESDKYEFADTFSYMIAQLYEKAATFGKNIMNVAIFLLIFSCILFSNFIVNNIKDRMGQIGILRALGTKKKDITQIYIIQNLVISLVIFIISLLLLNGVFIPMLGYMSATIVLTFPVYEAGLNDYLLLLGITTVTSIIASIFPLIRLSRKSPREIIYGK